METLKRIFTGSNFWAFNALINLVIAVVGLLTGNTATTAIVVMWVSFAAYEIIRNQEKLLEKQ